MTGIGGGLGGSVGIASESTYGTWVAPSRWVEVHDAKMQERIHIVQGTGLAAGRVVDLGSRRAEVWADAGGTLDLEFLNTGQALLLANAMGSSATLTQIGTTSAYTLTCNLGVPDNQNYFSMQSLVPDTGGTLHPENYHGCKITKTTFTIDTQSPLMWSLDIDSQYKDETQAAGSPSYVTTSSVFTANNMSFLVGAFGSEVFVDGVRKFEMTIQRAMATDRFYIGGTHKEEPITNGVVKITGSADLDLTASNKSVLWDLYHSQAAVPSVVASFTGAAIGASGHNNTLRLNATDVFIDSNGTPELDGPGVVSATIQWSGLIDAANDSAFIATLTTGDTAF